MDEVEQLLFLYGEDDQRTDAWHTKRGEMLTASEIHKALKDASPAMRHELIMSKLVPRGSQNSFGSKALLWGTRLEPIAKHIYSTYLQGGVEIRDMTCVPHPEYPFLGASPDGILITKDKEDFRYGKLVEFKCPISREFSDTTPIPLGYYCQMQLQMECTRRSECDYVEMKFREVTYSEWVESQAQYKSWFAVDESGKVVYRDLDDKRDVQTWRKEMMPTLETEWWTTTYWVFDKYRLTTVPHDKDWLPTHIESFRQIWSKVADHRAAGTLPDHPKEKETLVL